MTQGDSRSAPQVPATEATLLTSNRRLESLLRVSQGTASAAGLQELMQTIVDSASSAVEVTSGAVYLRTDHDTISLAATNPALPQGFPDEFRVAALHDHPHIREALTTGRPIVIPDARTATLTPAEREVLRLRNLLAILFLPVLVGGDAIGVLILSASDPGHTFHEEEISFLQSFANQAARGIETVRSYEQAKRHALQLEKEVAERRRVEGVLREREARLRGYVANAPYGVFVADRHARFVEVNPAATRITGYDEAELLGMGIADIVVPESQEAGLAHFRQVLETGLAMGEEMAYRHASGQIRYWKVSAARVTDDRFIGFVEDTTTIREAQQEVRRFKIISDNAVYGTAITDLQGRFLYVNPFFANVHGYQPEDLIGRNLFVFHSPRQMAAVQREIGTLMAHGSFGPTTIWHARRDGTEFPMLMSGVVVKGDAGTTPCLAASAVDMTAHHRAEEERDRAHAQLLQAQKMESVGRLAGGVAHDFNNMLGVILGHAEMAIEQVEADTALQASLEEIRKAAQRSSDLTRQLLAFARKQTVVPRVLDLNATIAGMLRMLQRLIGENIDLAWKPGHDVWALKMDPAQIDQMLANLCVNARDAIAGVGTVVIETANTTLDEDDGADDEGSRPGDYVLLSVSDNGCGMDPEIVSRIFEPFFTTKEVGRGTGLGLATVYGAVRQNNGFVEVCSAPGRGTTFRIYLPRHATAAVQDTATSEPRAAEPCRGTVLLVEDEPAILRMTTRMLEQLGYTVVAAGTPGEALRLATDHAGAIDLLLTDVVMPEMSGRDLVRRVLSAYPDIRYLLMSGYPAGAIARQGVLEEGMHIIQKPFTMNDLAAEVRRALTSHDQGA